ncbi:MAG: hypothetical protein REI96_10960 [Flavobacterium nitrogenifigens]|uniref:hypothetical protein n=1 Tax=Flavobacterium nitrogenifigens TaxID=1617283 RepID=UPI002807B3FF|nr:hypothetical protein [Flavobacterium nitrogenifigens]MDQ8012960.1 hypothetical protein [Flavobacterium nitrogenifigens]
MSEIKLNKHQEMLIAKLRNRKTFQISNVHHFQKKAEFTDLSLMETIRSFGGKPVIVQHGEEQIASMTINFNSPIIKVELEFSEIPIDRLHEMVDVAYGIGNQSYLREDMTKDNHILIADNDDNIASVYLGDVIKLFLLSEG